MRIESQQSAGDRAGPGDWVREAVRDHERRLVAYASHLLGDAERARDVVQEAFVRLCGQEQGKVGPHLAEWLFRVCRNLAIDIRRKEKRMSFVGDQWPQTPPSARPLPLDTVEQGDTFAAALRLMEALPPNQQEVIRLKFQQGLSYKEISDITGLTVTNVGFLMHTGLKTLRTRLQERDAGPMKARNVNERT